MKLRAVTDRIEAPLWRPRCAKETIMIIGRFTKGENGRLNGVIETFSGYIGVMPEAFSLKMRSAPAAFSISTWAVTDC